MNETETERRLKNALDAVKWAEEMELEARKNLAACVLTTKRMREKKEEAFMANEAAVVKKLRNDYNHCTK